MEDWLDWARGPAFRACLAFTILGLGRHLVLSGLHLVRALEKAGDRRIPAGKITAATLAWLFPLTKLRQRTLISLTSIVFHVGLILVPIFLTGHIALWERGAGVSWPGIPATLADVLTLTTIAAASVLLVARFSSRESRTLTRPQDVLLLVLLAGVFASGYLVAHPGSHPFGYTGTMLVHVLLGNLVLVLMPLTKLAHVVLLPLTQVIAEVSWRFPPDAGERVASALGKEGEPI